MDSPTACVQSLKTACTNFAKDLNALPEDAFTRSFGGVTRTIADITYEVTLFNDHVGMVIRGEQPFTWPEDGWIKAPADIRTKEEVIAAFEKSTKMAVETAESLSAEELGAALETENGESTRTAQIRFITLHLWYHAGQLNFIQAMLGDDEWNWK